jgi:hypothetical protein
MPTILRANCPLRSRTKFARGRSRPNNGQRAATVLPLGAGVSGTVWYSDCYRERAAISRRPRNGHDDQGYL